MSGAVSIGTIAVGAAAAVGGAVLAKSLAPKPPSLAEPPKPTPAPAGEAATKTPGAQSLRRKNAAVEGGPMGSSSGTLLTGPAGVNTDSLSLGKTTLLGG